MKQMKKKLTEEEIKALDIFKKVIRNRNASSNAGIQWKPIRHVSMDEHIWLQKMKYQLAYDEYDTSWLTIPNNTICKNGVPIWTICIQRELRKRGGCYRKIMPLITKIPIDKVR